MKLPTIILLLLITLSASAQFLSRNKKEIVTSLGKTHFISTVDADGDSIVYAPNVSGCSCTYIFDKNDICRTEVIVSPNKSVVYLIMGLENDYCIKIRGVYWFEQSYGLVEVRRNGDMYIFNYKTKNEK